MSLSSAAQKCLRHFADPFLCLVCVYIGVLNTTVLPPTFLTGLSQYQANSLRFSLLAALPIAIIVWRKRAYAEWCATPDCPLGERVLTAISIGIVWGLYR